MPQGPYRPPARPVVIPIEGRGLNKLAARLNRRSLIIGPEGIGHDGKQGTFRIGWRELRRVAVTIAYHQDRSRLVAPKLWRVRVVMDAADAGFPQRHPEIAGIQGRYGGTGPGSYGLPLGPVQNLVPQIAQALAAFAGPVFGGVIDEGWVWGMGYL